MAIPLFNIGGLASGLDTDAIISSVMDVERLPINQLQSRRIDHQIEDNAWSSINTRYSAIRSALDAIDTQSELNGFALASSSSTAVSATVTGTPGAGSTSFTVDQLAANHQVASASDFSGGGALVGAGDFTITKGGVDSTITLTASTTLDQLVNEINNLGIGVSASVVSVDGTDHKLLLSSDATGDANTFSTSGTVTALGTMDVIQQGQDSEISIGSGASALTLSRSTNTISDLIDGVNIELSQTTTSAVTVSTTRDVDGTVEAISALMQEVNSTLNTIADLTKYSPEADSGGPLVGNSTARTLALELRSSISSTVNASSDYPMASTVGISLNRDGTFDVDESKLRTALETNFDEVVDLLVEGGSAADARVGFVASSSATVEGDYDVVITQAAAQARATSSIFAAPGADSTFQVVVGSTTVDVSVTAGQNVAAVASAINTALTTAGVTNVTATATNQSGNDYIELSHSAYGSGAGFEVIGDPFGLAGTYAGTDVAGTIGGQAATGSGQSLSGAAGDPTGLILRVTATASAVSGAGGSLSLGQVSFSRGVFGSLDTTIGYAEGSAGRIARAQDLTASQIDLIDDRIEILEDRLDRREALLIRQYAALETAMSSMQTQSSWLSQQIASLNGGGE